MKKLICGLVVGFAFLLSSQPAHAISIPSVSVQGTGIELCPQSVCGFAVFFGVVQGQVGSNNNALGLIAAALNHEELPTVSGACAAITGGFWGMFLVTSEQLTGLALPGGRLCSRGDNTFSVSVTLLMTGGGFGTVKFNGVLDHNTLIPTWSGTLSSN